jgi:hypothetical protein
MYAIAIDMCRGPLLTVREYTMMEIMNRITDKVGWEVKVFDEKITQRWRKEAMGIEGRDVSEKMMDWVKILFFKKLFMTTLGPCLLFVMRSFLLERTS